VTLYHGYSGLFDGDNGLYSESPERERCRAWGRTVWPRPISYIVGAVLSFDGLMQRLNIRIPELSSAEEVVCRQIEPREFFTGVRLPTSRCPVLDG
jgi:hypothetical protein